MSAKRAAYLAGMLLILQSTRHFYRRRRHRQIAFMPSNVNRAHGVNWRDAARAADPRFADRPSALGGVAVERRRL